MNFFKPVKLFSVFGFDVKADSSWIFISILISWTLSTNVFPHQYSDLSALTYQHMAAWSLFGLIISILAHELAHAVIAEYYNMPIISIRLFIFGGVAEMKGAPSHPRGEFFMAVAGPIMSFLMATVFWSSYGFWETYFGAGPVSYSLKYLGDLNFILVIFNMVPAFPLDGGRALRALIWHKKKSLVIATRIASDLGEIFAYMLMAYGSYRLLYFDDLIGAAWLGLLGIFMLAAGKYAVRQSESWSVLEGYKTAYFMDDDFISVSPDISLIQFVDDYVYEHYQQNFPVVDQGKLTGMIAVRDIMNMDRKKWSWQYVRSVMVPAVNINTVSYDLPAAEALDLMQRLGLASVLVTKDGKLVGILNMTDIVNFLSITMKLDHQKIVKTGHVETK